VHESAHLGIKKRGRGRVLRDGFRACLDVASDAKRSLRPAEHAQRLSFAAPEESVGFLGRMKTRCFFDA